jgi:hypothetical protein
MRMVVAHVESADGDTTQSHRQAQDRTHAVWAERCGKIGPAPFRSHIGAGDGGVVDERLSAGTLPGVAFRHFEHAAGPVGCRDVVRDILLISQHDAAARDTEKVHARLGHMSQRLNHTGTPIAQGGEPAQTGG